MNTPDHGHLTPEQLEDAARGLLTPDRMAEVDAHCATCSRCRDAYEEERLIAAGTRSWARAALKHRIAGAIAKERQRTIPWPRILTAAAVVLVLAGTGIVYRWLSTGPDSPVVAMKTVSTDTSTALADRVAEQNQVQGFMEPSAAPPARLQEEARQERAPSGPARSYASAEAARKEDVISPAPLAQADAREEADALENGGSTALILWGHPSTPDADLKDKAAAALSQQKQQVQVLRNGMGSSGQSVIGAAAPSSSPLTFLIGQQSVLAMVRRDARLRSDEVPARISRIGDTVHIVLMPDPPLPDAAIRSAFVRTFPPDSFQVVLPGQVWGFKAPPGLLPDQNRGRR